MQLHLINLLITFSSHEDTINIILCKQSEYLKNVITFLLSVYVWKCSINFVNWNVYCLSLLALKWSCVVLYSIYSYIVHDPVVYISLFTLLQFVLHDLFTRFFFFFFVAFSFVQLSSLLFTSFHSLLYVYIQFCAHRLRNWNPRE